VPLLNEAEQALSLSEHLASLGADELILVDGGSDDQTVSLLQPLVQASGSVCLQSIAGRARQMNLGSQHSNCDYVCFLHADTRLPADWRACISGQWGRFDIQFDSQRFGMRMVAWFMNWRSRLSHIATGDQAMFVQKSLFEELDGFSDLPIMEDVDLSRRLKDIAKPTVAKSKATTSARRWERDGLWRTIFLMWRLRSSYALGVQPAQLKRRYRDVR